MITINFDKNERFNSFYLTKNDLNSNENLITVDDDQLEFFISKLDNESKQIINLFTKQQIKYSISKKRIDNLNAIQNNKISKNGYDDKEIQLNNYRDYYHIIFKYNINQLNKLKDILREKYNITNVNLYKYDQNNLIYIFDKNSNFEFKINSNLFSNFNNRINNYDKNNLIDEPVPIIKTEYTKHLLAKKIIYESKTKFWYCSDYLYSDYLYNFNNIFDQNWYIKFKENMQMFFNKITK